MTDNTRLQDENKKLQDRITYQEELLSQRAKLDNLLAQNQAAILQIQGRISMLEELIADDDNNDD